MKPKNLSSSPHGVYRLAGLRQVKCSTKTRHRNIRKKIKYNILFSCQEQYARCFVTMWNDNKQILLRCVYITKPCLVKFHMVLNPDERNI